MLKKWNVKKPFQLFLTILLPFLLSSVVLLFIQSSLLTQYFESYSLELIYNQQKADLQHASSNVNVMASTAKSLAITAYFDNDVKNLLFYEVNPDRFIANEEKVRTYKFIFPFLQSMYVYNGKQIYASPSRNFIYERNDFEDQGIFDILDRTDQYKSNSIVLRRIPYVLSGITTEATEYEDVYSYLFFESPGKNGRASEAIVLNMKKESIMQSIIDSENGNNRILIVDRDGRLMSDDAVHPLLTDLSGSNYIQMINASSEKTGSMRINVDGVDSYITYSAADVFDWMLISVTPYAVIVQDIEQMKHRTYLFVVAFIAGSILLSFYFSRRLYKPIQSVIQNYNMLETEKRDDYYFKKQSYLRKMVYSDPFPTDHASQKQFDKYNVSLQLLEPCLMILFKIDHVSEFMVKYSLKDRSLMTFGIANIISELLASSYPHECIEMEEDQILVLMNYDSLEWPTNNEALLALVREIQLNTEKYLNLSTSVTFSDPFETLASVNFHYLKTLDLSNYRLILGHRSIISSRDISVPAGEFKYNQDREKQLTDALIQGRPDIAKEALSEFIRHASQYSYTVLNSALIQLLLSIRYTIEMIEANHSIKVHYNFNTVFTKLQKIETLDEIQSDFDALFVSLSLELEAKKDNKYIKLLDDVVQMVHRDFANPALSLESIADRVNLSPEYLRKLFKKHRLISLNDLINNVRLAYASDRISSSDDTILEIMEKTGFVSRSHFYTQFKKTYGVTPSEYRSNVKGLARE